MERSRRMEGGEQVMTTHTHTLSVTHTHTLECELHVQQAVHSGAFATRPPPPISSPRQLTLVQRKHLIIAVLVVVLAPADDLEDCADGPAEQVDFLSMCCTSRRGSSKQGRQQQQQHNSSSSNNRCTASEEEVAPSPPQATDGGTYQPTSASRAGRRSPQRRAWPQTEHVWG